MNNLNSKKFIVVMLLIVSTVALASAELLTAQVAAIFSTIAAMYPAAQGYVDGEQAKNERN